MFRFALSTIVVSVCFVCACSSASTLPPGSNSSDLRGQETDTSKSACETAGFQCVAVTPPYGGPAGNCPVGMTTSTKSCDIPGGPVGDFVRCCAPSPVPPPTQQSACEAAGFQCVAVTPPPAGGGSAGPCPAGMTDTGKSCDIPGGPIGDFVRCCAPSPVP